jgi:hypothetical protein
MNVVSYVFHYKNCKVEF